MLLSCAGGRRPDCTTLRLALVAALAAVPALAAGQFTSGVNLVEVYAAVVDGEGQPVTGLTQADFTVLEDGRPQSVSAFAEGDFPLSIALAVDRSFSMSGERLRVALSAARTFLGELRPEDRALILAVGSEIETVSPLSNDREAQYAALSALQPWGTTGLYDAIVEAIGRIQPAHGRRALVLLSDGNDRYSHATAADALACARQSDVMIYPIAVGESRPPVFAELAALTGGRSFHSRDPRDLQNTLRAIAQELRHQYLLGYSPSKPIVAGEQEWRAITVRVDGPNLTVRARDGYIAK
jgi:Ca-activated chloride channel family protein